MGMRATLPAAVLVLSLGSAPGGAPDLLVADFEGGDYGAWTAEGRAFGTGPARGTLPGQMPVTGFLGRGLVNSFHGGDSSVGTLTSPPFRIERRYLNFLIGGGKYPGETCVDLLVGGQVVRTATGPNDRPGGSERLAWQSWDLGELAGQQAAIRIVDRRTGGWGHINVDHIVQSDVSLQEVPRTVELTLTRRYLNFPVANQATMRRLTVAIADGPTRELDIQLAEGEPDFWVFMDVGEFAGKQAAITSPLAEPDASLLQGITNDDTLRGAKDLYREQYRPQFHFSSRRGWNNDPNGLVYHQGEYHLFYQHNPYGWGWGNMHWGHAVSRDLVHWQELPVALYPDALGTCFSGSAVVDTHNTAGFQTGPEPPIVCIYTAAGEPFTQCLAYSNDRGRTWTKYEANPVLGHIVGSNRDPKVIWYDPRRQWIMALYLDGEDYALFSSPDLKQWTRLSDVRIGDSTECPEFFEMPVEGKPGEKRWVFYGGNGRYLVGTFDGVTFTPEAGPQVMHYGNCFYASQTFNDIPPADGRRILIGWGTMEMPGMPFNQMMTFPVELTLRERAEGPRLFINPVREILNLHGRKHRRANLPLPATENPLTGIEGDCFDISVELELQGATQVGLDVRGIPVVYNVTARRLSCLACTAPLETPGGLLKLRLLVDRTSIEVFAQDGEVYMPVGVIPSDYIRSLDVFARGGAALVRSLEVCELKSAWG